MFSGRSMRQMRLVRHWTLSLSRLTLMALISIMLNSCPSNCDIRNAAGVSFLSLVVPDRSWKHVCPLLAVNWACAWLFSNVLFDMRSDGLIVSIVIDRLDLVNTCGISWVIRSSPFVLGALATLTMAVEFLGSNVSILVCRVVVDAWALLNSVISPVMVRPPSFPVCLIALVRPTGP